MVERNRSPRLNCKEIIVSTNENDTDNHKSYSRDDKQVQQVSNANESHESNEQISRGAPGLQTENEGVRQLEHESMRNQITFAIHVPFRLALLTTQS